MEEWENTEQEIEHPVTMATKKPRVTKATKKNAQSVGGGVKSLEGVWLEMERERFVQIHTCYFYRIIFTSSFPLFAFSWFNYQIVHNYLSIFHRCFMYNFSQSIFLCALQEISGRWSQ